MAGKLAALILQVLLLPSIADVSRRPSAKAPLVGFCTWHSYQPLSCAPGTTSHGVEQTTPSGAPSMPQRGAAVAVARHAPFGSSLLMVRHMSSSSDGPEALLGESEGIPLVYMAAQDGRPEVVSGLLESEYSPNQAGPAGRTPAAERCLSSVALHRTCSAWMQVLIHAVCSEHLPGTE